MQIQVALAGAAGGRVLGYVGDRDGAARGCAGGVDRLAVRDRYQPGLDVGVPGKLRVGAQRGQERLLPGVVGVCRAEQRPADPQDHRAVRGDDGLEGLLGAHVR